MDQDSFRRLLQTSHSKTSVPLGAASGSRGSQVQPPVKKKTTAPPSQPAFKPRNVKKSQESKYRDRAAERRHGDGNDYAHVEAVLEDFEKRHADEDRDKVEAQRKYLGGDSEHSILVKGLDFALLEQNKAKTMLTTEDLDALDQAFMESSTHRESSSPKKRTREDLLRELKEQQAAANLSTNSATKTSEQDAPTTEQTILKGKFKPIGQADIRKKKSKSDTVEGEKKKKKRKLGSDVDGNKEDPTRITESNNTVTPSSIPGKAFETPSNSDEQQVIDDDYDIFAGAGEYEGVDIDEDYEEDGTKPKTTSARDLGQADEYSTVVAPRRWIESDEPKLTSSTSGPIEQISKSRATISAPSPQSREVSDDEDVEDSRPARLVPLSSSALPSIKDFLAMDKAAGSYDKKKKRKDKKKADDDHGEVEEEGSKKMTMEAKVDRDFQRLKSYTEKKAAAGNR